MPNSYFRFKQFTINQDKAAMKVSTDACLFGAWTSARLKNSFHADVKGLDIGAGTGLLSLMLVQELPVSIQAVEIDQEAAAQAAANFGASIFSSRLNVVHSALQQFAGSRGFQLIISNPPFFSGSLLGPRDKKNLAHHE